MPEQDNEKKFVVTKDNGQEFAHGEATLKVWTKQQAMNKAIKVLFSFWTIAVVCLFIPIIHYIAVPFFLISAPFVAFGVIYRSYKNKTDIIIKDAIACYNCEAPLNFSSVFEDYPVQSFCTEWQSRYKVELES